MVSCQLATEVTLTTSEPRKSSQTSSAVACNPALLLIMVQLLKSSGNMGQLSPDALWGHLDVYAVHISWTLHEKKTFFTHGSIYKSSKKG